MDPKFSKDKILKSADRFAQQGKFDAAIVEYKKVLEADPNDIQILNTIGDLYARMGKISESIRFLSRVAEKYTAGGFAVKALAVYKKINKLDPSNYDLAMKLGDLYARQNLMADAHAQYLSVAESHRRHGNLQEAHRILKKIADLDPSNTKARLHLAKSYEDDERFQESAEAYRVAGQELLRRGSLRESIQALEKAHDLNPESRPAIKALAEAYSSQGNVQPALDMIAKSLEIDPNDIDLIVILGRTFLNAGMIEKAEATFNRLLKLDNSRYDYLLEVARAYVDLGQYNRTMAIIDRCIELLLARRQKKKATALLKAILERQPDNVLALKRLAGIYKQVRERRNLLNTLNTLVQAALNQGMRAEAIVALKQLIEIEPTKAAYQEQLKSLGDDSQPNVDVQLDEISSEYEFFGESRPATAPLNSPPKESRRSAEIYDSYGDYSTELLEEMIAQHPEFLIARLKLLEDLVAQQPNYLEGRLKLRQYYLDSSANEKAAEQCVELAHLYEQRDDTESARQYFLEAYDLNPSLSTLQSQSGLQAEIAREMQVNVASQSLSTEADLMLTGEATRLTDLLSLEEFERYFEWEWRRASRDPKPLSLLKIGIDRYALFVGEHGEHKAIRCMEVIAAALENQLTRAGQLLAYTGEQEFYTLLPETHPSAATTIAESMRAAVYALGIPHPEGHAVSVSLSVSTAFPYRLPSPEPLIVQIDQGLLKARAAGGNKVITSPLLGA